MPLEIVDLNDYQVSEWPSTPEGEERQAQEVVMHYKTLFSSPLVESITWWNLSDGGWLNAPAGLLRQDHSPKSAYEELLKLVKGEWWLAPTKFVTNADGQFTFNSFMGDYELSLDNQKKSFSLNEKNQISVLINL